MRQIFRVILKYIIPLIICIFLLWLGVYLYLQRVEPDYLPKEMGEMVQHKYLTLSYNTTHKQANWVYHSPRIAQKKGVKRTNDFREDKTVPSGSARPEDYSKSGYDRGHLCPAGDMNLSIESMSETFYMSNMSPQDPGFNRGIWKNLEEQIRIWGKREKIHIVTGPVFKNTKGKIGKSRITIPGFFYKIVYSPQRQQMIAFILPNQKSKKHFSEHVVSVDSVESISGIDFFQKLPEELQDRLEKESNYELWK